MLLDAIKLKFGYDEWATERVLRCAEQLSPDDFVREDDTPWGSIRNQFVHLITVHWRWLSWVDGSLSGEEAYQLDADPADFPDVASVRRKWNEVRRQTDEYLSRATEDGLQRLLTVEWPNLRFSVPAWQILLHICNHSMQHRTEATMSLTKLGQSPGDLDLIFYALEQNAKVET